MPSSRNPQTLVTISHHTIHHIIPDYTILYQTIPYYTRLYHILPDYTIPDDFATYSIPPYCTAHPGVPDRARAGDRGLRPPLPGELREGRAALQLGDPGLRAGRLALARPDDGAVGCSSVNSGSFQRGLIGLL